MQDTFIIQDLEQLKAFADPLRQRILAGFCCQPATTMQVATQLGEKPTRLYHHVDQLEKAGLIELVDTQQNRGTIEKYYQAVGRKFVVDHRLLRAASGEEPALEPHAMLVNMLQASLVEARDFFDAGAVRQEGASKSMVLAQAQFQLSESAAQDFIGRICEWMEACNAIETEEGGRTYTLKVAFFPIQVTGQHALEEPEP